MDKTAYNHVTLPTFMYGTAWKKDATSKLVKQAVEAGFKAIDTANQLIHYHEALVGDALLELQKQGIARDALFLQTKFTPLDGQGNQPPYAPNVNLTSQVNQSMDSSLIHLHTDYVDSYVLHGPYSRTGIGAEDLEVWAAMEELYRAGKTRMLGVSNVSARQLALLCDQVSIKPMVVQNRCYAQLGWDSATREICQAEGIVYQGFSLLTANLQVLRNPAVQAIALRLKTGVQQVVFKFAMLVGMLPLTGTSNVQHMKEDLQSQELELTGEDVCLLQAAGMAG